jgi:hypothetical protein
MAVSGAGFLFVVGFGPLAITLALVPVFLAYVLTAFLAIGYAWAILGMRSPREGLPRFASWPRYMVEGTHCAMFYGILVLFLASAALLFYPAGLVIPLLILLFHPLLMAPMVFALHDKSFLGLMDACLDAVDLIKKPIYLQLWAETTLYMLIFGLAYLISAFILLISMIGIFWLPALAGAFGLGYGQILKKYIMPDQPVSQTPFSPTYGAPSLRLHPGDTHRPQNPFSE